MTKKGAVYELMEIMDQVFLEFAEDDGGYPGKTAIVADHLVTAQEIDGQICLCVYDPTQVVLLLRDIRQSQKEYPEESLSFHVYESEHSS